MKPLCQHLPTQPMPDGDSAPAHQKADDLGVTRNNANGNICRERVLHGAFKRLGGKEGVTFQDPG